MTEVGLYLHVPFCQHKCGYCDFYSVVAEEEAMSELVDCLLLELEQALARESLGVRTIFVGGGTPSVLPEPLLDRLMAPLGDIAAEHRVLEFTVEANPGSLDESKARLLREHGVTRMSIGAQSFHPMELQFLERIHSPADIHAAADLVHRIGFEHFNLDLIFGVPGQTLSSWESSLHQAVALDPDHLACYGLTFESGTPLERRREAGSVQPLAEELEIAMLTCGAATLSAGGFERYEISNYARPGGQCLHNIAYWQNRDTLGIGPAAASYLHGRRWRNLPDHSRYVARMRSGDSPVLESERLLPEERAGETAMLMLRMTEGIDRRRFHQTTGYHVHELFAETIQHHIETGLIEATSTHVRLSERGRLLANEVMADFLRTPSVRAD